MPGDAARPGRPRGDDHRRHGARPRAASPPGRVRRARGRAMRLLRVDTSRAQTLPGVLAVLTGDDLPVKFGILPVSQDEEALARDKVRYVGDPIAAVAATDEWVADEALDLIDVQFTELPHFMSIAQALAGEGEPIHGTSNVHKA